MSKDTAMRKLRQLPNPENREDLNVYIPGTGTIARSFAPAELVFDGLAEAIRLLLTNRSAPSDSHLLSVRPRVAHVVEANEGTKSQ